MRTTIIIFIIAVVFFLMLFFIVKQTPRCEEWENGYFAMTKMRNSYFLSFDLEEAKEMYDGLIIQRAKCVKTNKD